MKKLYIADLDGTLFNKQTQLSAETARCLTEWQDKGLEFTIATIRSIHSIKMIFGQVPVKLPVIEMNGAFVTDFATGRKHLVNAFDDDCKPVLIRTFEECGLSPAYLTYSNGHDYLSFGKIDNPGLGWYYTDRKKQGDKRFREGTHVQELLAEQWVGLTFIDHDSKLEAVCQLLTEKGGAQWNLNITSSLQTPGYRWLTVHPGKASKQSGIVALKEQFGFSAHYLVCFGDQPVDLGMFAVCDFSVAVSNAHPDVREAADLVIGNHDEDAVIRYIIEDFTKG